MELRPASTCSRTHLSSSLSIALCALLCMPMYRLQNIEDTVTTLAAEMRSGAESYDSRVYTVCAPWTGERGDKFVKVFYPAFQNGLLSITDDFATLREHLDGVDPGGANGVAHNGHGIGGAQGAQLTLQSQRAHRNRSSKLQGLAWKHCLNEAIRNEINRECRALTVAHTAHAAVIAGLAAGAAVPAYVPPPGWPAGTVTVDTSAGQMACMVLRRHGIMPTTGLTTVTQTSKWETMTLRKVGYTPESMIELKNLIDSTNMQLTTVHPANVCRLKFLQLIDTPAALVDKAVSELQRATYLDGAGLPDYGATVAAFDELWRTYFSRGDVKHRAPAGDGASATGNRVDGMEVTDETMMMAMLDEMSEVGQISGGNLVVADGNLFAVQADGTRVMICFKCKGMHHSFSKCPSKQSVTVGEAIRNLQAADAKALDEGPRTRFMRRGGGRGKGASGRGRGRGGRANTFSVEMDDQGVVYDTESGMELGVCQSSDEQSNAAVDVSPSMPRTEPMDSVSQKSSPDIVSTVLAVSDDIPRVDAERNRPLAYSADTMMHMLVGEEFEEQPDYCNDESPEERNAMVSTLHVRYFSVLAAICGMLACMATFTGRVTRVLQRAPWFGPVGIILSVLAAYAIASSCASIAVDRMCSDIQLGQSAQTALCLDLGQSGRTPYCNVDTGTSKVASGRITLFPESLIIDKHPNIHVRVANGVRLRVKFVGVLVMKTAQPVSADTEGKLMYLLGLIEAYYVPDMPDETTLVSTRTMYRYQGIKSYFNDDLSIRMPSGRCLTINETGLGYFLPFDHSFDARKLQPSDVYIPLSADPKYQSAVQPYEIFKAAFVLALSSVLAPDLLHNRLCHASWDRMHASGNCTTGLNLSAITRRSCDSCERGGSRNQKAAARNAPRRKFTRFGQRVSSDQCAMPKSTPLGFENFCLFYDLATKWLAIYFTRGHTNAEIQQCFRQYEADHKEDLLWCGGHVLEWLADNHGEFVSKDMDKFLAEIGTKQLTIVPWNPQQNPTERLNGIILRGLRITLAHGDATVRVWPFLAVQIVQVQNSLANRSETAIMPGKSAYEMRTGRVPDLSVLRVPLCRVVVHVRAERDRDAMGKLAARGVDAVHLCWDSRRKGYMAYATDLQRLSTWRASECTFHEDQFPRLSWIVGEMLTETGVVRLPSSMQQEADASAYRRQLEINMRDQPPPNIDVPDCELDEPDAMPHGRSEHDPDGPPSQRTRARLRQQGGNELVGWDDVTMTPVTEFGDVGVLCLNVMVATADIPATYYECLQTPEKEQWMDAYNTHMAGKMANGTVTWVPQPDDVRESDIVDTKLVPAAKYNDDNTIQAHTIRWVAKGYTQIYGRNFNETYSATAKATSMRVFFLKIMVLGMKTRKFDVPKAFTRAALDTRLYVRQPESKRLPGLMCSRKDKHGRYYIGILHKALEGLKQAGNLFQKLNVDTLVNKLNFKQFESEPCIFILHTSDGLVMLLVWVDDFATGYTSEKVLSKFVRDYKAVEGLDLKDEGVLKHFAGIDITFGDGTLELDQARGIERGILRHFPQAAGLTATQVPAKYDGKNRCNSMNTCALLAEGASRDFAAKYPPFLSCVALAMYYASMTRGDLLHTAVYLARFSIDPNEQCFTAAIELLSCLYHTRHDKLRYTVSPDNVPKQACQAGYESNIRSNHYIYSMPDGSWKLKPPAGTNMNYAGWIIFMYGAGVDWSSKLIKITCHSSAEVEIAAGCFCGKRAQHLRSLLNEFEEHGAGTGIKGPLVYLIDNEACGPLTSNVGVSRTTEHFLRWQHYLRWLVAHKYAVVIWLPTTDETGDIMTKIIAAHLYLTHKRKLLGTI